MMIDKTKMNVYACDDPRPCFARHKSVFLASPPVCTMLTRSYKDGTCPFCKPDRLVTNGKTYPYNERLLDHNARKKFNKEEEAYAEN